MKRLLFSALLLGGGTAFCSAADFEPPVRLKAGDAAIRVESPGYAAPCWADIHGCEPTTHRGPWRIIRPTPHYPPECLREPPAAAWLGVG